MSTIASDKGIWNLSLYKKDKQEVMQSVETSLLEIKNNFFLNINAGIDWFFYLANPSKKEELQSDIENMLLNIPDVTEITKFEITPHDKYFAIYINVNTIFGEIEQNINI